MRVSSFYRAEDGSALVISLVFIGIWAVFILAILAFAETGFGLAAGTADQRDVFYGADAAVEASISSTRSHLAAGGDPADCPSLRFVHWEPGAGVEMAAHAITVDTQCDGVTTAPSWFPYETWTDCGAWLDELDGAVGPCVFDGDDIPILDDAEAGRFGDVDGDGEFDEGEPTEASQFVEGNPMATASTCLFPGYEVWDRVRDGSSEWLDDPSDDSEGGEDPQIFDGGDLEVRYDAATASFYADVDGDDTLSAGDSVEGCEPVLIAGIRIESGPDHEASIEQWQVIR